MYIMYISVDVVTYITYFVSTERTDVTFLLVARGNEIGKVSLDSVGNEVLQPFLKFPHNHIRTLSVDWSNDSVVFADFFDGVILRAGLYSPSNMYVDFLVNQVSWTPYIVRHCSFICWFKQNFVIR